MARFKVGDVVRVLPYDEISRQFIKDHIMPSGCAFPNPMMRFCDGEFTIKHVYKDDPRYGNVGFYKLRDADGWSFTDEMLEDIVPLTTYDGPVISFDDLISNTK